MTHEMKEPSSLGFGKHVRTRFVSGLLVLIPLAITLFVLNLFFSFLTAFVRPLLRPWTGNVPEYVVMLLALAITLALVYTVGVVTTYFAGRRMIHFGERLLLKLPIVRSVYAASKQVVETFSTSTKAAFQAVVFVDFPRRGSLAIGFVTGIIRNPDDKVMYRVFVATTPNPTSGFLLILPEEEVYFTNISVEEGVKMIVSGGMLAPERYQIEVAPLGLATKC